MEKEHGELSLFGGRTASEVVRVGDTVHRSMGTHSEFSQSLLKVLEEKEFSHAPRFLGIDEKGREILTYIEGEVVHGEVKWTDTQLNKVVEIIRDFHNSTEGSKLAGDKEVVCHNDIAPWNVVVKDNVPVALIDFDGAEPGNRVDDLAYFLWTFLELGNDTPPKEQATKIKLLCDKYGFKDGSKLVGAILEQQEKILKMRKEMAKIASNEESRKFSEDRIPIITSEMEWVKTNREILESVF